MIIKSYEIPIDIEKGVLINKIIKVVTQDLGTNMIRFRLVKDGRVPVDLTGTKVRLTAKSRSGSTIQQECVIENEVEGVVTITLKQSMFAEDGTYIAELQISDSSTQSIRLTTPTFNYFSRKSLQDDDVVVAGDDYSILQDLMNDLAGIDVVIMQGRLDALELQSNENATKVDLKANKKQENWIAITPLNGWTSMVGGRTSKIYKDEFGIVHFSGAITGGLADMNTLLFTLPTGYRPETLVSFAVRTMSDGTTNSVGIVEVGADGNVKLVVGEKTALYINSISFKGGAL